MLSSDRIENYPVDSATCIQLLNNCGQIGIMHAWYMCNQQSLMNGLHRKPSDHTHFDLLSHKTYARESAFITLD